MSYAEFTNEDGSQVIIDDQYYNMAVRHSARLTVNIPQYSEARFQLSFPDLQEPLLAFRSTAYVFLASTVKDATTGITTFNIRMYAGYDNPALVYPFEYWVFDRPAEPSYTYSLTLYDAQGNITFDARRKYLRWAGLFDQEIDRANSPTYTLPGDYTEIAFIQMMPALGFSIEVIETNPRTYFQEWDCYPVKYVPPKSFKFQEAMYDYSGNSQSTAGMISGYALRCQVLAIDVSHILIP